MNKPPIQVGISTDKMRAALTWSGPAELTAHEIDLLIRALGMIREVLSPAVPVAPPPLDAVLPPLSNIELRRTAIGSGVPTEVGAMFLVRSPQFGWLDCPMGPEFCANLASWLQGAGDDLGAPKGAVLQ